MEETKTNTISKPRLELPAIALLVLLLSLVGGAFGSFVYLDLRSGTNPMGQTFNSRINVEESSSVIDAAKKVNPSVVSITGVTKQSSFFGGVTEAKSSWTGFIVRADGLIVTNKHVISGNITNFTVYTSDGKSYDAVVKAIDPIFDIAILKIEATNLPIVGLGSSDGLQLGQTVIAIGNALGQYQNSVTVGVVSAVGRVIQAGDASGTSTENLDNVIQTDAAINPGNSGGPLLNIAGQVIGINTAVDSSGQSIGFAIPVNLVKSALDSYVSKGKISRAMLGVRYISLNKEIATENKLPVSEGAYIYSNTDDSAVVAGSPAERAGLTTGDIITAIGEDKVTAQNSLVSLLSKYAPLDTVRITWLRSGETKNATVQLSENSSR